jgi:hypothetical protein
MYLLEKMKELFSEAEQSMVKIGFEYDGCNIHSK